MADFADWPEQQRRAMAEIAAGFDEGTLEPLAAYFRAGYTEIEPTIARYIADMIGGGEDFMPFRIEIIGRTKRPRRTLTARNEYVRRMAIGTWVEQEVRASPKGAYSGIVEDACTKFSAGKTAVTDAHREIRRRLSYPHRGSADDLLAMWADIFPPDIAMSPD